ncbi:Phage integrase [Rhodovulum sp. PH10]|nr:Phage integrase [Rhodovulum sp. PH10]
MWGRIESILDRATERGYCDGENPALALPPRQAPAGRDKVRKVEHHAALPCGDLPDFMTRLRDQEGVARASEFAILTAARTGRSSARAEAK